MKLKKLPALSGRTLLFISSGVILTWLVLSQSFAAFLADNAPNAALWLHPQQPEALVVLADRALRGAATANLGAEPLGETPDEPDSKIENDKRKGGDVARKALRSIDRAFQSFETLGNNQSISRPIAPEDSRAVRNWLETALMNDPLNARAFRILGQLAEANSDDADTKKFMQAAEQLSLHQRDATFWLLQNSTMTGDFKSAINYADILLRTSSQSNVYVVPILAKISEDKTGAALVKLLLASNPPWRERFISALPNSVADARTPLDLLLALRSDPVPLTAQDIDPYLNLLIAHKLYSLAYYTWLQFLPRDELRHAGFLYNGNFDNRPSGLPFDWQIEQGTGVTIDIVPRPDRSSGHALMVDFQFGRVEYHSVNELVMLAPGTYQFSGEYKGQLLGPRGLKWRIACAGQSTAPIGESAMISGSTKNWADVAFTFAVPEKGCDAQYVRLDLDARMASEELVSGSIFFDALQISRAAKPAPAGG